MFKTAMIFTSKMVLQRNKPVPVWGEGNPGETVKVTFDGNTVQTTVDENGSWKVELPPHEAGKGYELTVWSAGESLHFTEVSVGEVWLAGGQSNMEYLMGFEKHYEEELGKERTQDIHFFDYPEVSYEGEMEDFHYTTEGFWRDCTDEDLQFYSAVGYYFAKELQADLDVPIGIIGCNWGGTPACAWMDPERLMGTEGEAWVTEYEEAIRDLDVESYKEAFVKNPQNDRTRQIVDPFNLKIVKEGISREEQEALMKMMENMGAGAAVFTEGPYWERRPGGLYETMLKKVVPYALRGVIWYQGETDGDSHPDAYASVFSSLIENWRELWGEELPFLFVQLAPFGRWLQCIGEPYAIVREQQEKVADTVPGTWMASIGDAGMEWDIHPKDKKPVGERLALLARGHVYGESILCDAPKALSASRDDGDLVISFENGEGLHIHGDKVNALSVKGPDGVIREVDRACVHGSRLRLLGAADAVEVIFAKGDYYEVNLYNGADIPALPFRLKAE